MTMRSTVLIASVLSLAVSAGCNNARDQQEKADKAQAEANEKIADANRQADDKINEAQAKADEKTAEAQADFTKLRENFRHEVNTKLADLDKKIAEVEAKARTYTAQKKAEIDTKLSDIRASRDAFVNEYRGLETVTALTWDDYRKRVDKSLDDLEAKVDRA
jgi:cell division septum initiation protein DivIVA